MKKAFPLILFIIWLFATVICIFLNGRTLTLQTNLVYALLIAINFINNSKT